jgi:hypothetical protein
VHGFCVGFLSFCFEMWHGDMCMCECVAVCDGDCIGLDGRVSCNHHWYPPEFRIYLYIYLKFGTNSMKIILKLFWMG